MTGIQLSSTNVIVVSAPVWVTTVPVVKVLSAPRRVDRDGGQRQQSTHRLVPEHGHNWYVGRRGKCRVSHRGSFVRELGECNHHTILCNLGDGPAGNPGNPRAGATPATLISLSQKLNIMTVSFTVPGATSTAAPIIYNQNRAGTPVFYNTANTLAASVTNTLGYGGGVVMATVVVSPSTSPSASGDLFAMTFFTPKTSSWSAAATAAIAAEKWNSSIDRNWE